MSDKKDTTPIPSSNANDIADDGVLKWTLTGAGGAGKKSIIRYAEGNKDTSTQMVSIDTSGSSSLGTDISNIVEMIRIKDLNGSGKLRAENHKVLTNFISSYVNDHPFEDVNVLVYSFSGGSGSVIGPLLTNEILRAGKVAIVLGIIDTDSEVDTINALNTLKTLQNYVSKHDAYLPIVLFDNDTTRLKVDNTIDKILDNLTRLFDIPYEGLDRQDRIKFLQPNHFQGISGGIKLLNISSQDNGDWEDSSIVSPVDEYDKIDATMIITDPATSIKLSTKCNITYRGFLTDGSSKPLITSIGYEIPTSLIEKLNAIIHSFRSMSVKETTVIDSEYVIGTDTNGLVL
jgi:hypothetical protein